MPDVRTSLNANRAFEETLKDILDVGTVMQAAESKSIGSKQTFQEIHNYHLVIDEPQQRLLKNASRPFKLTGAIARFIWMMAGNNRLADIEFYWGAAIAPFTDDGATVPGSSYGARMFNSSPGMNQVDAIIHRLRDDSVTRRAAVSIYQPFDAVRDSNDIPCTFGLFYHIREGKLVSTVIMRSNNAFILLPYNLFEFSLLAEVVACEVGVPLGHMCYNAISMHIYEKDFTKAKEIVDNAGTEEAGVFPAMPSEPSPMQEIQKLVRLESRLRHLSAGLNNDNINDWLKPTIKIDNDEIQLHEYWRHFYYLLLYHIVDKKTSDKQALQKVADQIQEPYKSYLSASDWEAGQKPSPIGIQQDLFGVNNENVNYMAYSQYSSRLNSLEELCSEENTKPGGKVVDFQKYVRLRNALVGDTSQLTNIAARNQTPQVSKEEFQRELDKLE